MFRRQMSHNQWSTPRKRLCFQLLMTKICEFPGPIHDLTKDSIFYSRPDTKSIPCFRPALIIIRSLVLKFICSLSSDRLKTIPLWGAHTHIRECLLPTPSHATDSEKKTICCKTLLGLLTKTIIVF